MNKFYANKRGDESGMFGDMKSALLVLAVIFIVLIVVGLLMKRGYDNAKAANSCNNREDRECRSIEDGCQSGYTRSDVPFDCKDDKPICCIKNEAFT